MSTLLARSALTLRRDRGLTDLVSSATFGTDVLFYTYVVEADGDTVLRVTNDYTLSQAFFGSFGGFTLSIVDAQHQLQFVLRRETGLTSPLVFLGPGGETLWQTDHGGDSFVRLLDPSGQPVITVQREGTLYPTYTCSSGGSQVGVVDTKFNGLSELFNKGTRYELTFSPGATEEQRRAVLSVGLYADISFGSA